MPSPLVEAVAMLALTAGILAGGLATVVCVHELGHYVAARLVVGIPANE